MRSTYINYIISEFIKVYPWCSSDSLRRKICNYKDDDVYRVANTIERFGIEILENLVRNNV